MANKNKIISYIVRSSDIGYAKKLNSAKVTCFIKHKPCVLVKIGKSKYGRAAQRHIELIDHNLIDLEDLVDYLPFAHRTNIGLKLSDNILRNFIIEKYPQVEELDKDTAKNLLSLKDGYTEILLFPENWSDKEIADVIENCYYDLLLGPDSNFIANKETEKENIREKNRYTVSSNFVKNNISWYNIYMSLKPGSKVLVIRQFPDWFIDRLVCRGLEVYYLIDNKNATIDLPAEKNLHLLTDIDTYQLKEYIMDPKTNFNFDKFDLVIENPPYGQRALLANEINKNLLHISDEVICLAPPKAFVGVECYIDSIDASIENLFENAKLRNLAICRFGKKYYRSDKKLEYEILKDNLNYNLIYNYNKDKQQLSIQTARSVSVKDRDIDDKFFFITGWTPLDGVHIQSDAADIKHNIYGEKIVWDKINGEDKVIRFNSNIEMYNFTKWWYSNPKTGLADLLISLINLTSRNNKEIYQKVLPAIDWSRTDVEYTDEYVLSQMGLKWNENKDGVEKL